MKEDFIFMSGQEVCLVLGTRLRAHRLAQNMQQAELAAKAGVSKLTIINLENKGTVTFLSFVQVMRALGLLDELSGLFELQVTSIAMMEAVESATKRVRASSRRKRVV